MREIMISGYSNGMDTSIIKYWVSDDWHEIKEIWQDRIESPSYLSTHQELCFAVSEMKEIANIYCYKKVDTGYSLVDQIAIKGGALCHIYYSPRHKTLYGSFYLTGHVVAVAIEDDKFTGIKNYFRIEPAQNKDITRAHCCAPDLEENRIFVCNIALDRVYVYNIEKGALTENEEFPYLQLEPGEGPRHIKFHPLLDIAYIITEYSNKLITLSYDRVKGIFKILQTVSTLPEYFLNKSFGASLTFSPDGKYLYASNRGANTIGVFEINREGLLNKLQDFECGGDCPRHIDVTADGRYLMVANQDSGGVAIISISEEGGRLENHVVNIPFHLPAFVVEIKS